MANLPGKTEPGIMITDQKMSTLKMALFDLDATIRGRIHYLKQMAAAEKQKKIITPDDKPEGGLITPR